MTGKQVRTLLDRVAATRRFVGLDEIPPANVGTDDLDDGAVCNRDVPCSGDRLVEESHVFYSEAKPLEDEGAEVHQETVVYRTAVAASDGLAQVFDTMEQCKRIRYDDAGQVVRGCKRPRCPTASRSRRARWQRR